MSRVIRGIGWLLVSTGVLILLYLVYLMFFTGISTDRAQQAMLEEWELEYGVIDDGRPIGATERPDPADVEPVDPGEAYAVIWFERDGERIVHEEPLFVVEGVTLDDLRDGPGHYPDSAAPGGDGNFAVSGHRTTNSAPFYDLDQLEAGDEVHVVDRAGARWVYTVTEERIVAPTDVWVVGDDPLGTGEPLLTLTTCHPRFSAAQRLIVFATLTGSEAADEAAA